MTDRDEREYTKTDYVQWLLDNHPEHFYEYFDEFEEAVK